MKKKLIYLSAPAVLSGAASARDIFGGVGLPGLHTLGYAKPMGASWGVRADGYEFVPSDTNKRSVC
jgi:hypothetical protein